MNIDELDFRYSAILFDFDGTLTHSLPLWMNAYQNAMAHFGVKMSGEEVVTNCFYRPWQEVAGKFDLPSVKQLEEKVLESLEEEFADATLFEGVMHTLAACRSKDTKLAIVTSSGQRIVEKFLRTHDISDYFGSVVAADHVKQHKPHPEPVLLALSQLELSTQQTLMIGDSPVDMRAAKAAKVTDALFFPDVHHTFYDFEELRKHNPHFIFHSYSELMPHISLAKDLQK